MIQGYAVERGFKELAKKEFKNKTIERKIYFYKVVCLVDGKEQNLKDRSCSDPGNGCHPRVHYHRDIRIPCR